MYRDQEAYPNNKESITSFESTSLSEPDSVSENKSLSIINPLSKYSNDNQNVSEKNKCNTEQDSNNILIGTVSSLSNDRENKNQIYTLKALPNWGVAPNV